MTKPSTLTRAVLAATAAAAVIGLAGCGGHSAAYNDGYSQGHADGAQYGTSMNHLDASSACQHD